MYLNTITHGFKRNTNIKNNKNISVRTQLQPLLDNIMFHPSMRNMNDFYSLAHRNINILGYGNEIIDFDKFAFDLNLCRYERKDIMLEYFRFIPKKYPTIKHTGYKIINVMLEYVNSKMIYKFYNSKYVYLLEPCTIKYNDDKTTVNIRLKTNSIINRQSTTEYDYIYALFKKTIKTKDSFRLTAKYDNVNLFYYTDDNQLKWVFLPVKKITNSKISSDYVELNLLEGFLDEESTNNKNSKLSIRNNFYERRSMMDFRDRVYTTVVKYNKKLSRYINEKLLNNSKIGKKYFLSTCEILFLYLLHEILFNKDKNKFLIKLDIDFDYAFKYDNNRFTLGSISKYNISTVEELYKTLEDINSLYGDYKLLSEFNNGDISKFDISKYIGTYYVGRMDEITAYEEFYRNKQSDHRCMLYYINMLFNFIADLIQMITNISSKNDKYEVLYRYIDFTFDLTERLIADKIMITTAMKSRIYELIYIMNVLKYIDLIYKISQYEK